MKKIRNVAIGGAMLMLCAVLGTGCAASFRGGALDSIKSLEAHPSQGTKPSVYIDSSWRNGVTKKPDENAFYMPSFTRLVRQVASESDLFGELVTAQPRIPKDYTIKMSMLNYGSSAMATILGAISGATLTVIPAYARDNYRLDATVYDSTGSALKDYQPGRRGR